ncbi:hypothetical protein RB195_006759 [Necator americanus]|uniref:Uncharacterized protein n=1 Tax=Necator americanus TaxID=51031 RepID=A0ABR1BU50_NECAM
MSEDREGFVPITAEEVVQISGEELEELLNQARQNVAPPPVTMPSSANTPTSSTKPNFSKPGLARQFDFNSSILNILIPLKEFAPEDFEIRGSLSRAISQRNELLTTADTDP